MTDYDFELEKVVAEVKSSGVKRVGLQFPEGLKDKAAEVARRVEDETGAVCIVFSDPTYGGCDLKTGQAEKLGVDLLVHFGHTEFHKRV